MDGPVSREAVVERTICLLVSFDWQTEFGIFRFHHNKNTGTEITSVKDVLTDMMITQKPLTAAKGEARLIHSGFHAAFYSVLDSVQHGIEMVIGRGRDLAADGWTVRVCESRVCV